MSDSGVGEEKSGQVEEKLNPDEVLPHLRTEKDVRLRGLRCSKCHDFFRGQVFGCTKNHTTCSLCCGVDIKSGVDKDVDGQHEEGMEIDNKDETAEENKWDDVVCPMEDCKSKTSFNCGGSNLTRIVGDLRLKVPCKNRNAGCPHKCVEEEMEEHEDECGDRKVKCDGIREDGIPCGIIPFKDLLHHLKDFHEVDIDAKKWLLFENYKPSDESVGYMDAYMYEIGPDGLVFLTDIIHYKAEGFFGIAVRVMGGKQVSKKYRVEMRVSSNKSSASLSHSGPVYPIEYSQFDATRDKESFEISASKFAFFNNGKKYFGKHNEDKNGEIVLPLSVKIEKKKLGLATD